MLKITLKIFKLENIQPESELFLFIFKMYLLWLIRII